MKSKFPFSIFHFPFTNGGFTLIELLIVLTIIGTLATLTTVNYLSVKQRARDSQRKADIMQIQSALEMYRVDNSTYPAALPACGTSLVSGNTVYLQKTPCDPLNTGQFIYTYSVTGSQYTITSCLENVKDIQKDNVNNSTYCTGGTQNWSYTVKNP